MLRVRFAGTAGGRIPKASAELNSTLSARVLRATRCALKDVLSLPRHALVAGCAGCTDRTHVHRLPSRAVAWDDVTSIFTEIRAPQV